MIIQIKCTYVYILEKLNKQIDSLSVEFTVVLQENENLKNQIELLKNQNDQLKYNNENMLLNIDKALNISQDNKEELEQMTFHINHKSYTVEIEDIKLEESIKKFLNLDANIDTTELLSAYIKKTNELVQLENSLEKLSLKIDDIKS